MLSQDLEKTVVVMERSVSIAVTIIKFVIYAVLAFGILSFVSWVVYQVLVWFKCLQGKHTSYFAEEDTEADFEDQKHKNGFTQMRGRQSNQQEDFDEIEMK